MATSQEQFDKALAAYRGAGEVLARATLDLVGERIRAQFPTAATLVAHGETNEDSILVLRAQRVLDADGAILYDVEDPTDEHEEFIDQLDTDLLDWLIHLDEDDYRGDQEIPVAAAPPEPVLRSATKGSRWRLAKGVHVMGSGGNGTPRIEVPAGTEVTVVDPSRDYLDWFCCVVQVGGETHRLPWALHTYASQITE